jgi:hypothetical protein
MVGSMTTTHEGPGNSAGKWDIGDPEPEGVTSVLDYAECDDYDHGSSHWGRTSGGEWKGYKDGGKVYLSWAELTRRWGPLTRVAP